MRALLTAATATRKRNAGPRVKPTPDVHRREKPLRRGVRYLRGALVGLGVVIAALELHPVSDQVLGAFEVRRPGGTRDESIGLPKPTRLAPIADDAAIGAEALTPSKNAP
jgi:hypothetical protein